MVSQTYKEQDPQKQIAHRMALQPQYDEFKATTQDCCTVGSNDDDKTRIKEPCHPKAVHDTKCSFDGTIAVDADDDTTLSTLDTSSDDLLERGIARVGARTAEEDRQRRVQQRPWSKKPGVALGLIILLIAVVVLATSLWLWLALKDVDEEREPIFGIQANVTFFRRHLQFDAHP
ncbi:expressed unknown protein [Seminavis robusta]|uniref:Uncharacterized protein n=1 Tax=Seminavis robusta TaxID=568900 RepID=A0A9N8DHT5_9STRA|nr:expressed unknown protein [Seminavis robusta]|eukprot:Sro160_g072050.1 n/a (175) ;mRNA; f:22141-22665